MHAPGRQQQHVLGRKLDNYRKKVTIAKSNATIFAHLDAERMPAARVIAMAEELRTKIKELEDLGDDFQREYLRTFQGLLTCAQNPNLPGVDAANPPQYITMIEKLETYKTDAGLKYAI